VSALLANRWLAGTAAWLAVSALVWLLGAGLPPAARLSVIVALAGAWLGWEFWRKLQERRRGEGLFARVAEVGAPPEAAAGEIEALRAGFERAAALAAVATFRGTLGEPRPVYELPWYVIIGAPGSGKTTALTNAGLRFPLSEAGGGASVQGVGGTRNCDWWFTESAVLLDTAGRYTTQDSDRKSDAAAWFAFLELLRSVRPQLPLNGVLVTVSASDLMLWGKDERSRYAAHVRMRLQELHAALAARLPIYVLVTKTDLVAGFLEFFDAFDAEQRAQIWGITIEHGVEPAPESLARRFAEEFARLERRLYAEMIDRLHEERDLQRRAAAYRFPQQFHVLGPLLGELLGLAFSYRQDHQAPMLRGIYFTSGTQQGSPIDRVLGAIARSFNVPREALAAPREAGRSYFLGALLRDLVFREAGLAATAAGQARSQPTLPADALPPPA
jgi:type VI secretion system protein ImpL